MQEGAGGLVVFLLCLAGGLFGFEKLRLRFPPAASAAAAIVAYLAFFLPNFANNTNWPPDGVMSVLLLMTAYYLVTALTADEAARDKDFSLLELSLACLVFVRPEGYVFLPLFLIIGVLLLVVQKKMTLSALGSLIVSLVPALLILALWRLYVRINRLPMWFTDQRLLSTHTNLALAVGIIRSMTLAAKTSWWAMDPILLGFLASVAMIIVLWRKLDHAERPWAALLVYPVYNALVLFLAYISTFSPYEASTAQAFARYMTHSALVVYFLLAWLLLRWFESKQALAGRAWSFIAGALVIIAIVSHLAVAGILSQISPQLNNNFRAIAEQTKSELPYRNTRVQFIAQSGPVAIPNWASYYLAPEITVVDPWTVGASTSNIPLINTWRDQNGIRDSSQFIDLLLHNVAQGVLVYQSDDELERLMGIGMHPDSMYLFRFDGAVFTRVWSAPRPDAGPLGKDQAKEALHSLLHRMLRR
jgi:hypothetical protein